jgi:CheY-like chemotaxis protein
MKRVLVVDDEPPIRQVIGDVLRDEGYGVLFASSGHGMLKVLETERPDLVLLDLMMPDGDGWEVLQTMQAQPQLHAIPVVIISTGVGPPPQVGVSVPFLSKPFDLERLLVAIAQVIGPATEPEPS